MNARWKSLATPILGVALSLSTLLVAAAPAGAAANANPVSNVATLTMSAGTTFEDILLAAGEKYQVIEFNPSAALQKSIFADSFVPNSGEFRLTFNGLSYAGQRAEHLSSGVVRVYYVQVGDWGHVGFFQRGVGGSPLGDAMLAEGERQQVIQFNPDAALQQRIFTDGFVPNSSEMQLAIGGGSWVAQRAEHLGTGRVRVYYAATGDWGNVRYAERGATSGTSYTNRLHGYTLSYPTGWTVVEEPMQPGGRPLSEYQMVTLRQPGYGTPGNFTRIFIYASKGVPPFVGMKCTSSYLVAGIEACRASYPGGQNPPQETVAFQKGDTYYTLQLVYEDAKYVDIFNNVLATFQFTS